MKYTLKAQYNPSSWNGIKALPHEIHVVSHEHVTAEFELLTIICSLHGYLTAFDILIGGDPQTDKETDILAVLTAFQHYLYPKMPLSRYTGSDQRVIKDAVIKGSDTMNRYQ